MLREIVAGSITSFSCTSTDIFGGINKAMNDLLADQLQESFNTQNVIPLNSKQMPQTSNEQDNQIAFSRYIVTYIYRLYPIFIE